MAFSLIQPAFAQDAASAGVNPGSAMGSAVQFLPILLIFLVFYVLLIRPQQQRQKALRASLMAIKRGDRVVTGGGIIGTVYKTRNNEVELEIAPTVRVMVLRDTISAVLKPDPAND